VHRIFSVFAVMGLLLFGAMTTQAAAPGAAPDSNPHGRFLGIVPVHNNSRPSGGGTSNLVYHAGGQVQTGTHHTYSIYWGADFSYNGATTYQPLIDGYFQNVAADSGKTSNVYYSDTQYYQTLNSTTTPITYSEAFGGTYSDPTLPASNGCSSTAGGSICVSDAQLQAEVAKARAANGWPDGLNAEYFVFLANGASTCISSRSCAFSQFCAYHSHYLDASGNDVLYANQPFTGHNLSACSGAVGSPNNNAAADATISVVSHEANETITDGLGNAWYDTSGNENGDKCAYKYGTALGSINGGQYNQNIGTGRYEMQQEWSNRSSGCVLTGT